jgi:hypothetical protein
MYNFFSDAPSLITEPTAKITNNSTETKPPESIETTEKIGHLVRTVFEVLSRKKLLSNYMVQDLLDGKYSKETFDINYPVLKKVVDDQSLFDQRMMNGY